MLQDQINAYFEHREDQLVQAAARLIAIRSVRQDPLPGMPFGKGPAEALAVALEMAQEMGFSTANCDNYVGTVDLNPMETNLGILCHLDVVGEGIGWSTPPYQAVVKDGMLYGRGSADDKGPVVAALLAMKAVRDLGISLKYNVRLILGTDEESGCEDTAYYFSREKTPPHTFSPDGTFPVINTEKGGLRPTFSKTWPVSEALPRITAIKGGYRTNVIPPEAEACVEGLSMEAIRPFCAEAEARTGARFALSAADGAVIIQVTGKGEHAATPEKGLNAVTALLALLATLPLAESESFATVQALNRLFPHGDYYGQAAGIAQSDQLSGPLTLSFNIYNQSLTECSGRFDSRTPLCATKENSEDIIRAHFSELGFQMQGKLSKAHHTPGDSAFVQTLLKAYEQYTGLPGRCEATGGGTYVHGIDGGVGFGAIMPGFEANAHGADEHVPIQDLLTAAKIFTQVIVEICK